MSVVAHFVSRLLGRPTPSALERNGRNYIADFFAASREAGIRPFLMWGTLLGCVRENRLLAHDHDVDVGITPDGYFRRDALIKAMRRRGYRLNFHWPYKLRFTHRLHGTWLDVDVFYPWQGSVVCSTRGADGRTTGERFPQGTFDTLREVDFLGLKVLIPDPPEAVLETIYGEWRVPRIAYDSSNDTGCRFEIESGALAPALEDLSGNMPISELRPLRKSK